MTSLLRRGLNVNLASVNYRLSPTVKHPSHRDDVIAALKYLNTRYGMKEYVLVGHSAGACLAFQTHDAVTGCVGVVGVEGIYDLTELVEEYPDYESFVQEAFSSERVVWKEASPTYIVRERGLSSKLTVLLVQSREDELLGPRQTETMFKVLQQTKATIKDIAWIHSSHDMSITTPTFHHLIYNFITTLT